MTFSDALQPGSVPWPLPSDNPQDFPTDFASDTWPLLWPKVIFNYANSAARDAEMAGLSSLDRAFAWLEDTGVLSRFDGTAWSDISGAKWNTFAPAAKTTMGTTPSAAASSLIYGVWRVVGPKTIHAKAAVTITGATSGGAGLTLPFVGKRREYSITAALTGTSGPSSQVGGAMSSGKDHIVIVTPTFGFADAAAGNRISYDVIYETV